MIANYGPRVISGGARRTVRPNWLDGWRCWVFLGTMGLLTGASHAAQEGVFVIRVVDKESGEPTAARMHLKDSKGAPVLPKKSVQWKDHFVFRDSISLTLKPGRYEFVLERGPEYRVMSGHFIIEKNAKDSRTIELPRFVDLKKEGWWSGDLHIHRPPEDIELLMEAEDLHIAPVITWWNKINSWTDRPLPAEPVVKFGENSFYHLLAGEDEREGGALLFFQLPEPLAITQAAREFPAPSQFLNEAKDGSERRREAHVDIEKPFWWDAPVWIATEKVDSIGIAHNHMHRDGMLDNEAWGKARDRTSYPPPLGNGRWTHDIYFHFLNCGLRLPPSAGSASGVLPNPVGYNRVYVHVDGELTYEKWWENLRAGQVVVTNGPLLRPRFNGQLPGHVFQVAPNEKLAITAELDFALREKISYLELIKNGETVHEVRLEDFINKQGMLPEVEFDTSGWMLVRAITDEAHTFRFAMSGPVYVQVGNQPRISKQSVQFFHDWVYERARRIKLEDPSQRDAVIEHHRAARDYWQQLLERSNTP